MNSVAVEYWLNVAAIVFLVLLLIAVSLAAVLQSKDKPK